MRGGKRAGAGRPRVSQRVAVRLPLEQLKTVDRAAEELGVTRSELLRQAVERWVAQVPDNRWPERSPVNWQPVLSSVDAMWQRAAELTERMLRDARDLGSGRDPRDMELATQRTHTGEIRYVLHGGEVVRGAWCVVVNAVDGTALARPLRDDEPAGMG